jgi:tRNA modification GTPase
MPMDRDTIVALSTPVGEAGIAVIRISGPSAIAIVDDMAAGIRSAPAHQLVLRTLRDMRGEPLDEALIAVMRAPATYTGEDLVEISCHGGMQVVNDLLTDIMARGARLAGHGEFTKRAFQSGRIDLAQAEAVADLIAAETSLQRRVALEQLEGELSRRVRECEEMLLEELALVEVSIDFSEEDLPVRTPEDTLGTAAGVRERIARLLESEMAGRRLRSGIRATIVGPRNVGKSSIYNALLGEERAIVSAVPGTTRDLLRERIHIGGFTCWLEDTAGLAETGCEIEARGIMIGREAAGRADLVLFVLDGSAEIDNDAKMRLSGISKAKLLLILNKKDLGLSRAIDETKDILGVNEVVAASARTGEGLDELRRWIYERSVARDAGKIAAERVAVNARQADALREADEAMARLADLINENAPAELMSVELRLAADALGRITGRSVAEDLLDTIFSRFCIGK